MRSSFRYIIIILLWLPQAYLGAQQLQLSIGDKYRLNQSLNQNTIAETTSIRGNVSLDIHSSIIVEVIGENDSSGYMIRCRYEKLDLSMFSSDLDIMISSETRGMSTIMKYLEKLEEFSFPATLSPYGEFGNIEGLDEYIMSLYKIPEENLDEQDLIIKSVHEAFGEDALRGLFNISLNVYCEEPVGGSNKCEKHVSYSFNAKPVFMNNSFFIQPEKEGKRRIQGIGIILADTEEIEFEGGLITTSLNGNHTFDFLYDAESGWLLEGNSKQKVFLKTIFQGNSELPEGLEVPSVTESDYNFYGAKID